ncbi:UNKNOWN [Stylonychia lemnae]|uniref:Transmembrane protein n=1 Tax=Stylonychia lemnae TaxID=5949 RepID=A0A078AXG7_STYLE|nr:UNKNOWN [Stylonychia lemnae]|eukprot:CDW87155.1 UNKNOWN [Stylonychia lemnae]
MKLLDPFQGYRIASANVYMNLTYLLQIMYIIWWQEEGYFYQAHYALFVMLVTHSICFTLEVFRFIITEWKKSCILLPLLIDIVTIIMYQGAIFYIQIVYINLEKDDADFFTTSWIEIELITYYSQIIQAIIFLLLSSCIQPIKPSSSMRKSLSHKKSHDYLSSTKDQFQLLSYNGTMIIVSLAILYMKDTQCGSSDASYQTAIYYFVGACGVQLVMAAVAVVFRGHSDYKDWFLKTMSLVVIGLYGYLLAYFFIFNGCERLIKNWVVGNLVIIVAFVAAQLCYTIIFKGKEAFKEAISKKPQFSSGALGTKSFQELHSFKLGEDFYSITFFSYLYIMSGDSEDQEADTNENQALIQRANTDHSEGKHISINEEEVARNFINCVVIFTIQITLGLYALYQILFVDSFKQTETLNILVTRFLSAIILHINIESNMRRALNMMNYALLTTKKWYRKYPQIAVALMYFFGTFTCEFANLLLLCTIDNAQDIIINMIAFMVVADIQEFYSNSLQNSPLRESTPQQELEIKSWKESDNKFGLLGVLTFLLYKIIRMFYVAFYYYFMPFAVVFLSFLVTQHNVVSKAAGGEGGASISSDGINSTIGSNTTLPVQP